MLPAKGATTGEIASPSRGLVRRATPIFGILAVFVLQALTGAPSLLVLPVLVVVVVFAAMFNTGMQTALAAIAAGLAIVIPPITAGAHLDDLAVAGFEIAVLWLVAAAVHVVVGRARNAAAGALRAAAELRAVDERLRQTIDIAAVGLGLIAPDGQWVQVSERLSSILGRSREAMLQATIAEVTAESDRPALSDALDQLRAGQASRWEGELHQVKANGAQVAVAMTIAPTNTLQSGRQLLLVQAADITARKQLDGLRDSLVAVRHVIVTATSWDQAAPQVLSSFCSYLDWDAAQYWTPDADGSLHMHTSWHRDGAVLDEFDLESKSLALSAGEGPIGRAYQSGVAAAVDDLASMIGDLQIDAAKRAAMRSAVAFPVVNGSSVLGVIALFGHEAHELKQDVVTMLSTAGGEIGQFIQRTETTAALRRSEADHRAIFERSPIGIARVNGEGELLEGNPSLLRMLEYDFEAMRSQAWPEVLRAYDQTAGRSRFAPLLAGLPDQRNVQVRASTGGGRWLWLQLTATSIPDTSGRLEHILVMVEDVTAVRETQDQLAQALESQRNANTNLEKLDRTKTEFLSVVSHEFRTALTGIQGFSELIRDGGLEPEEVKTYGAYIFNDADRVNRLIGDMLDLDRMESGRMSIRLQDVDINEILSDSIVRAASTGTLVEFKADLDPRLPNVRGDHDRLTQVLANLVNNAVKYSPEGGFVTLSTRIEGAFVLISVTDTGIGIPADEIGHVFERFRRVRSGAGQSIPGTGLGLTIVKQIVEMHGGKIWVESAVGHGSAFHFTLPLSPEPSPVRRSHV